MAERARPESLADLLGGSRAAVDATVPPTVFVAGWLLAGRSVWVGAGCAVAAAAAVAVWRLRAGRRPRAVLLGLVGVCAAAGVALYTGRAADFFVIQLLANAASALVWAFSIVVRWPLLGVLVAAALRQGGRWRRDPALLRAYARGSWVWTASYAVRVAVFLPLYLAEQVVALGAARLALTWPLIAACLGLSWWAVRRSLPPDHPGPRHPRPPVPVERVRR